MREEEIGVARQGSESRLYGIEEDGVGESFGRGSGAVCRCGYTFLEKGPGKTAGGKLLAGIFYREGGESGAGGEGEGGGFTMKRICPQHRLVGE